MQYVGRMSSEDGVVSAVFTTSNRKDILAWADHYLIPGATVSLVASDNTKEKKEDVPLPVPK